MRLRSTNSALVFLVLLVTCGDVGAVECGFLSIKTEADLAAAQACTTVTQLRVRAPHPSLYAC
jgi:hypothetical protein